MRLRSKKNEILIAPGNTKTKRRSKLVRAIFKPHNAVLQGAHFFPCNFGLRFFFSFRQGFYSHRRADSGGRRVRSEATIKSLAKRGNKWRSYLIL